MKSIFYGHKEVNIPVEIEILTSILRPETYVMLTVIDSQKNVTDSPEVKTLISDSELEAKPYFGYLLFPLKTIDKILQEYGIFNGFDAIWLFENMPENFKMHKFPIVTPSQLNEVEIEELAIWMKKNNCMLGLGDGCGLNYITTRLDIMKKIEG